MPWQHRVVHRGLRGPRRARDAASGKQPGALHRGGLVRAELTDGPLAGSTREVAAIEGRPPKTIDVESGEHTLRYCLAEWEQSGHSATYAFLYEV